MMSGCIRSLSSGPHALGDSEIRKPAATYANSRGDSVVRMGGRDLGSDSSIERKALRVFLKTGPELANLLAPEGPAPAESSTRHTEVRLDQGAFHSYFAGRCRTVSPPGWRRWPRSPRDQFVGRCLRLPAGSGDHVDCSGELLVPPEAEGTER